MTLSCGKPKYEVSNLGRVRIAGYRDTHFKWHKPHVMYVKVEKNGYTVAHFSDGHDTTVSYPVHRLVALAFLPNPRGSKIVRHLDGNNANNRVDNLVWGGDLERNIGAAKQAKAVRQYTPSGYFVREYSSASKASKVTGISTSAISAACRRKSKFSGEHLWRFAEDDELANMPDKEQLKFCTNRRPVCQFTKDGDLIATYGSVQMAAKALEKSSSVISRCCKSKGKYTTEGFVLRYAEEVYYESTRK